ncbi:MAG: T9SS type A sorting domain-containing protein [Candidatus Aegiribacteria sp.]|nr:T9SS type A sorting domain-containing protein [Candidatus Aegiribacteria sp.]
MKTVQNRAALIPLLIVTALITGVSTGYDFGSNITVNDYTAGQQAFGFTSGMHSIAASGDTVCVVWNDFRSGGLPNIYSAMSTDGGESFVTSVKVNDPLPGGRGAGSPTVCIGTDGTIYVAWHDNRTGAGTNNDFRIYMSWSTDGGATFSTDTHVWDSTVHANFFPGIAVDSEGRIIVSFYDGMNPFFHIYCAVSIDDGLSFQDPVIVDDAESGNPNSQTIGIGPNDEIYISWHDNRNGNYDIYFARSIDAGVSFGTDVRVDDTGTTDVTQFSPSLAVAENDDICIAWRDHRNDTGDNNIDIYGCKSTDNGISFLTDHRINDDTSGISVQFRPSIAAGNNYIGVVWYDYRDGDWPDYPDIYYSFSDDEFESFSDDIKVNDNVTLSDQQQACLAMASDGQAFIAWSDNRSDPEYDVYFSVGTPVPQGVISSDQSTGPVVLSRNYPNPFSRETTISYVLNEPSDVLLQVYDIQGRLLETIVDCIQPSGDHSVVWSAEGLNIGCYFYRITIGDFTEVKSCVVTGR